MQTMAIRVMYEDTFSDQIKLFYIGRKKVMVKFM